MAIKIPPPWKLLTVYGRRTNSDTWHWWRDCRWWPRTHYRQRLRKPTSGELCDECRAKEKDDV